MHGYHDDEEEQFGNNSNPSGYTNAISSGYTGGSSFDSSGPASHVEDQGADDAVSEPVVNDIAKNLKGPGRFYGQELHESAHEEAGLTGGIHLFHGVEEALKETFPGWPKELGAFEAFQTGAEQVLAMSGFMKSRTGSAPIEELLNQPRFKSVKESLDKFMQASPLFRGRKAQYHGGILKVMARGVKYSDEMQRVKYRVTVDTALLMRGNAIFDTPALCNRKGGTSVGGSFSGGAKMIKTKLQRCPWVMTERKRWDEFQFYSHFGKLARFHHSSFTGGDLVRGAGEWFVEQGVIKLISGMSGHYRPTEKMFYDSVDFLLDKGKLRAAEVQVFTLQGEEKRFDALEWWRDNRNIMKYHNLFVA